METADMHIDKALSEIAAKKNMRVVCFDFAEDTYEILSGDWSDVSFIADDSVSDTIGLWFKSFTDNPLFHEYDRAKLKNFLDLGEIKEAFINNASKPLNIVFRSRLVESEHIYSYLEINLVPLTDENGKLYLLMCEHDVSDEIKKYNEFLAEEAEKSNWNSIKRSVLVVEDNEMNRMILSGILEDTYNVFEASNGAEGLDILQKHLTEIAVVVLDVQMPVMNGYEFLEITQGDSFLSKIPVVVATGSDNIDEERKCLRLGASDFVTKPYNPEIIMSRIAGIIRLKESVATMSMIQTEERTGLYTIQAFNYFAKLHIERHPERKFSLIVIDVDNFKWISDTYGNETGDIILHKIAEYFESDIAGADINGRLGAARFYVLRRTVSAEMTDDWMNRLFSSASSSVKINRIIFKAGIYDISDIPVNMTTACDCAAAALESVGGNFELRYARYDEGLAEKARRLAAMEADMREAYDNDEFTVYYQPKHDALTGDLVGAEAPIRWIHPTFGFLSPGEFIPLFERNGFISYADYYVLKKTCENLRKWSDEGLNPVPISINASRRDIERDNFMETVLKPVSEYDIEHSLVHIEITESLSSERMDEIGLMLGECKKAGFEIELDDFGAGYSSLITLASLPLDVMKLDMSFMKNYRDKKKQNILQTAITLAKSLGLRTVAEGVENEEQLELLKSLGCDWIQGYYFSKPLPEKDFREYLKKHQK